MKRIVIILAACLFILNACNMKEPKGNPEQWKEEVKMTEQEFARMAADSGIHDAFLAFADESAVLLRNNKLISGKEEISEFFKGQQLRDVSLQWEPDFVEVSSSGDLAYTYGHYTFGYRDTSGTPAELKGIFHTVWKRQQDGSWKFVWD